MVESCRGAFVGLWLAEKFGKPSERCQKIVGARLLLEKKNPTEKQLSNWQRRDMFGREKKLMIPTHVAYVQTSTIKVTCDQAGFLDIKVTLKEETVFQLFLS